LTRISPAKHFAKINIIAIAAMHSPFPGWVISGQTVASQKSTFVRYCPKADKNQQN
jgi:hypothetical protein